jgi:hypothetical protein
LSSVCKVEKEKKEKEGTREPELIMSDYEV